MSLDLWVGLGATDLLQNCSALQYHSNHSKHSKEAKALKTGACDLNSIHVKYVKFGSSTHTLHFHMFEKTVS